jgi:hypothetical protein
MEEVLAKKGFDNELRGWVMSTVRGGKVCVNINGAMVRISKHIGG